MEKIELMVEKNGDITFFRVQENPQTREAHAVPIQTMSIKEIADHMEKISNAVSVARPLALQTERIAELRRKADELEAQQGSMRPTPVISLM